MLTELIAANQRSVEENGNGNGNGSVAELVEEERGRGGRRASIDDEDEEPEEPGFTGQDPGASRRYRFRHPTASGKTIAAARLRRGGPPPRRPDPHAPPAARHQFTRDLTTEGYGERLTDAIETGKEPLRDDPITIQTYAWFARHRQRALAAPPTSS